MGGQVVWIYCLVDFWLTYQIHLWRLARTYFIGHLHRLLLLCQTAILILWVLEEQIHQRVSFLFDV